MKALTCDMVEGAPFCLIVVILMGHTLSLDSGFLMSKIGIEIPTMYFSSRLLVGQHSVHSYMHACTRSQTRAELLLCA